MKKIVVIGGVAGGMSAATRLRRLDAEAEIVVLEKSGYVSYANCGLPYYVGGVIEEENDLLLQTPASLHARFRLDVRVLTEALIIDPVKKEVQYKIYRVAIAIHWRMTSSYLALEHHQLFHQCQELKEHSHFEQSKMWNESLRKF